MPAADDVVEDVGGAAVARDVAELVEDQEIGSDIATDAALERGQRRVARRESSDDALARELGAMGLL